MDSILFNEIMECYVKVFTDIEVFDWCVFTEYFIENIDKYYVTDMDDYISGEDFGKTLGEIGEIMSSIDWETFDHNSLLRLLKGGKDYV